MNLNTLLAELEQSAGMEKSAGAKSEVVAPAIKDELASVIEKRAEQDLTKQAFDEGAELARKLLEKLAANEVQIENAVMETKDATKVVPTSAGTVEDTLKETVDEAVARGAESDDRVDPVLDKQAQENKDMAKNIMDKIAQMVGEPTTTPAAAVNVAGAAVPNMVQTGNAVMTAGDDAKVTPMPGQEGTINNILEALVAKAKAEGAGSDNLVDGVGTTEGAVALGSPEDMQEKAAAVNALVAEGMNFDTAVSLVKQAEAEIVKETFEHEKVAAVNSLVAAGYDFDQAIELVKQAEAEMGKEAGIEEITDMDKTAAVNELVSEGMDFDQAVELVKEAGDKMKGLISPAWMEHSIAKQYGDEGPQGVRENLARHYGGSFRAFGRGLLEGAGGATIGALTGGGLAAAADTLASKGKGGKLVEVMSKNIGKIGSGLLGAGYAGGVAHGVYKSTKNQEAEMHAKYKARAQEKKAALEALVAEGVDFNTAVDLVKQAELEVYGE